MPTRHDLGQNAVQANLQLIKQRLFDCAREQIARDYCLNVPVSAGELSRQVLHSLDQRTVENPLKQPYDNQTIFRAAVRAIGSNSRKWAAFLSNESKIAETLSDFQAERVSRNPPNLSQLATLLPGQSSSADARAILKWASLLSENQGYYRRVVQAAEQIQLRFPDRDHGSLPSPELFLCVVAYFTDPPSRTGVRKWPGMGFALGSEFLRNLRWNGFKPDRHIKRLLHRWTNDQINVLPTMDRLRGIIDRKDRLLSDNLRWSLTGMELTPEDHRANLSQVDNLIWLLGAYVEKKGRESEINYLLFEPEAGEGTSAISNHG